MTEKFKTVTYTDLLVQLCDSVTSVLSTATGKKITYSPVVQSVGKTMLTPDIGTFAMFTGCFAGMAIINFPKETAMELYSSYMSNMGIPEQEQAKNYTSEEVSNSLGELMNQILGNYTRLVSDELQSSIQQSQPKMLAIPRELQLSINVNLDNPKCSKVSFFTESKNVFYLEIAMDNVKFQAIRELDNKNTEESAEDLLKQLNI